MSSDGWDENSKLIMHRFKRLESTQDKMLVDLQEFREETKESLAELRTTNKLKQGMYGTIGGGGIFGLLSILEKIFKG